MKPATKTIITLAACLASITLFSTAEAQTTLTRDTTREAAFVANLNAQRQAAGLPHLVVDASMSHSAADWTRRMVRGTFLAHSNNMTGGVAAGSWSKVGENVGRGHSPATLTSAFMASPTHARNVLDPSFTHVGVAVYVHPNGQVYTTHRFAAMKGFRVRVAVPPPTVMAAVVAGPSSLDVQREALHEARMRLMTETVSS